MKVFLTGGTGAIGRHALKSLVAANHDVHALVRTEDKARYVKAAGAEPVFVSLFDKKGLETACIGMDAVVNLATAIPPNSDFMKPQAFEMNDRIRMEGSANLVDAALEANVTRFVQESVSMIYKDNGDAWIDESWDTAQFTFAMETMRQKRAQTGSGKTAARVLYLGSVGSMVRGQPIVKSLCNSPENGEYA